MAKKKPDEVVDVPQPEPVEEVAPEVKEPSPQPEPVSEPAGPVLCGHVNRQYYNEKGALADLACELLKGHPGNHKAKCLRNERDEITNEKGNVIKVNYHPEPAECEWSDAAGISAANTVVEQVDQLSALQKDLITQELLKNPNMTAAEALARLKGTKEWAAATALL